MSNKSQIEALEKNIKLSQEFVDTANALARLETNRDFIKVVQAGYFEREAVRLVHLLADPAMQKPESRESILNQIQAIGQFSSYLQTVKAIADRAAHNIEADRATIDELQAEEV